MINLTKNPFFLSGEDIEWVENTKKSMTLEEKIGQLFVPIGYSGDPQYLEHVMLAHHIGGIMYRCGEAKEMQRTHRYLQEHSKIPLLIGANLEDGGCGIATDGTQYGKQMQVAATGDTEDAYRLGKVSCSEGAAVGCNWAFAPVVDIDRNWRNPITNVRTYGDDPDRVLACGLNYMRAAKEENVLVAIKHFPGDGCDEVDQHILTSVNNLSCDEWDATYGKIYSGLIQAGAQTVMVGHIAQPAYQKSYNTDFQNKLIPATLSSELLKGLLRKKLGFNGLIVTDSTCMVGFSCAMNRERAVPYAIEAGCDMFLFNKDLEEDYQYMLNGYKQGILSEQRLDEAITRILATKASLGLHRKAKCEIVPSESALCILQADEHVAWAKKSADKAVTLVKDIDGILPLNPHKTKKVLLEIIGGFPSNERVLESFRKRLVEEGFEVIGVGTLEVDGRRGCRKVAEGRHVATQRKAQERHVGRTQAGRVAALGASAEVGVHEHDHAAQRTGVGDGLHKQTRGRSVHHQLLPGIVIAVNGNVVGHEVDVVDDAVEVIPGAEADETAQREGETVVLRGEDELRFLDLLEARTVGLDVVLRGVVHGHAVERRRLLHRIRPVVVDGVHLLHRDQVDRRRIFAAHGPALVTLRRRGSCKQQSHD